MFSFSVAATVFCLLGNAFSSPSLNSRRVVHEKRHFTSEKWTRSRKLGDDVILPMRFGMKQNNIERIEELIMDVSHPTSPNYGKHWSPDKIADTFAPSQGSIDAVKAWLHSEGVRPERIRLSNSRGWIEFNATTAEVERILETEYHVYTHTYGGEHIACDSYTVPEHVREHIDIILPSVNFDARALPSGNPASPQRRALKNGAAINTHIKTNGKKAKPASTSALSPEINSPSLADCDEQIVPNCLRALYNFTSFTVKSPQNSYGIVEYTPQGEKN
ncbi:hypothetical protein M422DRAFT_265292 [Sphaerobolus stellatus SS14]|uniref:Peptidase S53 activation domain-containing protein n=1 Tax=Sphaerobolus stellatus (strain SS14) TaxID=990650 RepID=A0A0C9UDM4_SPHS4|nr:hypothetical protein M422DRAFT_265292 [Sphaerobolus stellatus SS14]